MLLQQVGRALALWFAEDSAAGSRTAARGRLGCCSSSADAARWMLRLLQPGRIGADPTSKQRSHQHPPTRARYSLLDFGAGLGEGARPSAAMSEQPGAPSGAAGCFPPTPCSTAALSLQLNPNPLHQREAGIPVGGESPRLPMAAARRNQGGEGGVCRGSHPGQHLEVPAIRKGSSPW